MIRAFYIVKLNPKNPFIGFLYVKAVGCHYRALLKHCDLWRITLLVPT